MVMVPSWMVDDGQVALAAAGEVMRSLGVCAPDARLLAVDVDSGSSEMAAAQHAGEVLPWYRFTGRILFARVFEAELDPGRPERWSELIVEVADFRLVVQSRTLLEHFPVGGWVRLESRLESVAEYEWDDFEIPDVRADWRVLSVTPVWSPALEDFDYLVDLIPAGFGESA